MLQTKATSILDQLITERQFLGRLRNAAQGHPGITPDTAILSAIAHAELFRGMSAVWCQTTGFEIADGHLKLVDGNLAYEGYLPGTGHRIIVFLQDIDEIWLEPH